MPWQKENSRLERSLLLGRPFAFHVVREIRTTTSLERRGGTMRLQNLA